MSTRAVPVGRSDTARASSVGDADAGGSDRICSTRNVPPQQADWKEKDGEGGGNERCFSKERGRGS